MGVKETLRKLAKALSKTISYMAGGIIGGITLELFRLTDTIYSAEFGVVLLIILIIGLAFSALEMWLEPSESE